MELENNEESPAEVVAAIDQPPPQVASSEPPRKTMLARIFSAVKGLRVVIRSLQNRPDDCKCLHLAPPLPHRQYFPPKMKDRF